MQTPPWCRFCHVTKCVAGWERMILLLTERRVPCALRPCSLRRRFPTRRRIFNADTKIIRQQENMIDRSRTLLQAIPPCPNPYQPCFCMIAKCIHHSIPALSHPDETPVGAETTALSPSEVRNLRH